MTAVRLHPRPTDRFSIQRRSLAYTFSAVVLVTNQVTTRFTGDAGSEGPMRGIASHTNSSSRTDDSEFQEEVPGGRGGPYIIPALGNTWHHCVSNRVRRTQTQQWGDLIRAPWAGCPDCVRLLIPPNKQGHLLAELLPHTNLVFLNVLPSCVLCYVCLTANSGATRKLPRDAPHQVTPRTFRLVPLHRTRHGTGGN